MSRCFPFPPPGYEKKAPGHEKKAKTDDADLLKKEKHREKKHKKEKRDKEKKESKEKRDKEGRDGKRKEKKDKKEKHREKKKDKDKDRDKDNSKTSAAIEKEFPEQAHGLNAGKLHPKDIKPNDKKGVLLEDKLTKQYANNNGEKARENNHLAEENKDSRFLRELDRRIRDNDGANQLVQKVTTAEHRKDEEAVRLVAKGSGTWPDGKERLQDKDIETRKVDRRGVWAESRPIGNATVQNHAGNFNPRVDEMPKPLEKNFNKPLEATVKGEERVKEKKDDKQGDKKKNKEKGKKGHGKDKDRNKEKKKEEKAKENTEHNKEKKKEEKAKENAEHNKEKKKEEKAKENAEHENRDQQQNKLKENSKTGPLGSNSFTLVSRHSHENSGVGENLKKRKGIESNGIMHANDSRPSKLPKPSPSHLTENGRILEPCQTSLVNTSDWLGAASNVKVDKKERRINGIIEGLPSAVSSNKTPTATVPADPVSEASAKPPHPDAKYISLVYSVPKADGWSDFDEQEWLFGSSLSQERKPAVKSSEVGDTLQVWAEGMHIEPADIFALPYVIPY